MAAISLKYGIAKVSSEEEECSASELLSQGPDCKGWVTLLSPWNKGKIEISSRKLQRRMRKTGKTNIRKKVKIRGMRFARVNGNCCWEVKEYFHGGETKDLVRAHTYHLPWNIRSVKLVAC